MDRLYREIGKWSEAGVSVEEVWESLRSGSGDTRLEIGRCMALLLDLSYRAGMSLDELEDNTITNIGKGGQENLTSEVIKESYRKMWGIASDVEVRVRDYVTGKGGVINYILDLRAAKGFDREVHRKELQDTYKDGPYRISICGIEYLG